MTIQAKSLLMPLAALAATGLLAQAAAAQPLPLPTEPNDPNWLSDMQCQTLPTDAASGYVVHVFRSYLQLDQGKAEIYKRSGGPNLALVDVLPVTRDPDLGSADVLVDDWTGAGFHIQYHLHTDLDAPGGGQEEAFVKYAGAAGTIDGPVSCEAIP